MRKSLNSIVFLLVFFSFRPLLSTSLEEAKRNLDLGYYLVAEYLYQDLLNEGVEDSQVLTGLSTSLIFQGKYDEVIRLKKYSSMSNNLFYRNLAYSYFMTRSYYSAYYYYNKAVHLDRDSVLDITGRAWSAYYLGNASLAYNDFNAIAIDSLSKVFLDDNWQNNSLSTSVTVSNESKNYNLNYSFNRPLFSFLFNLNKNTSEEDKRDIVNLQSSYHKGKISATISYFNAMGDFKKLYDGYGLAIQTAYLFPAEKFHSRLSLTSGYSYYESLSAQEIRLDYQLLFDRTSVSIGTSYLYLDYITPNYDKAEQIFHSLFTRKILNNLTASYQITYGKSNFAYNNYLLPYDNYDINEISQSLSCTCQLEQLYLSLDVSNKDYNNYSYGLGLTYVF